MIQHKKLSSLTFKIKKLNINLLNWKEKTSERRKEYFNEIIDQGKFYNCKHKNKKMPVLQDEETYKGCLAQLNGEIEDEDDPIVRANYFKKLAKILSKEKTDKDRFVAIKQFRQEIIDGNTE